MICCQNGMSILTTQRENTSINNVNIDTFIKCVDTYGTFEEGRICPESMHIHHSCIDLGRISARSTITFRAKTDDSPNLLQAVADLEHAENKWITKKRQQAAAQLEADKPGNIQNLHRLVAKIPWGIIFSGWGVKRCKRWDMIYHTRLW